MPELHIITGSNGAGKSSIGPTYLPSHIRQQGPIFDGDKLFVEKRKEFWRSGIKSHKECGKLALAFVEEAFDNKVETALATKTDFAYEGHFTNEATWDIPRRFRAAGYSIHLIFLGLRDTGLSELRVVDRVQEGGHYVDPRTVSDNFYGNLEKLNLHYGMFHKAQIIDTSETEHQVLAILIEGEPILFVSYMELPDWFRINLPAITHKILLMDENMYE
ncbi:MAG: zeta toxin family protein [Chitinophagaceae bacterium]|nr:zeta toxin family protein [Chitinophagaceae bacterium]